MPDNTPHSILLIWIGRLGDLIVSTPFIHAMRGKYPRARITLLARGYVRGAADMIAPLDEKIYLPSLSSPADAAAFAKNFLFKKFDLCVDMNASYSRTAGALARLSGAKRRVSFDKFRADWFYTATVPAPKDDEHMLERYRRLAEFFGATFTPQLRLDVPPREREAARKLLAASGVNPAAFKVAVHAGNFKKVGHRWPEEKFEELTKRILPLAGVEVIYISGPGEEAQTRALAQKAGVKFVIPPLPLGTLAGLLQEVNMLIVSATGTMHLAAAVGTPLLSFQSGYTDKCWKPLQGGGIALASKDWDSLRGIEVDKAWQAFCELKRRSFSGHGVSAII